MPHPDPASDPLELAVERAILARLRGEEVDLDALAAGLDAAGRAELVRRLEVFEATRSLADRTAAGPRVYGDFEIEGELGRGGMGVVYRARQRSLGREVALKVLPSLAALEHRRVERFLREAALLGQLEHEGIVPVLTAGEDDGTLYFAMPYVRGASLDHVLDDLVDVPVEERLGADLSRSLADAGVDPGDLGERSYTAAVVGVAARVAEALAYAHGHGIVHRDVKPSNVILGAGGRPLLIDFGLAKGAGDELLTASVELLGTPSYLPPECVKGGTEANELSDVYSLGVLLYELLCGRRPFRAPSVPLLLEQVERADFERPRRVVRGLPRDLETICLKAMESDPARRYASMEELAQDLRAFLAFRPIRARPAGLLRRARMRARRQPALALGAGAVLLAAVAASGAPAVRAAVRAREAERTAADLRAALADDRLDRADGLLDHLAAIDEDHPERAELARAIDLARCDRALADAARLRAELDRLEARVGELDRDVLAREKRVGGGYTDEPERRALAALRADRARARASIEERRVALENALHLAETWAARAGVDHHPPVQRAFADHYAARFRAARAAGDEAAAELYRDLVRERDDEGRHARELAGLASLSVVGPSDARAWLFRYQHHDRVDRDAWLDRLVPVPFRGVGSGLPVAPGDLGLEVLSALCPAGLREGDLVLEVDGSRDLSAPFVGGVARGSDAERSGVRAWDRVVAVNGTPTPTFVDLHGAEARGGPFRVRVAADFDELEVASADRPFRWIDQGVGLEPLGLPALFAGVAPPRPILLRVLREGEVHEVELAAGEVPDAVTKLTRAPLLAGPASALGPLPVQVPELEPGSYLLLVRRPGYRDLRLPVVLDPLSAREVEADPPQARGAPPGCAWIAPGEVSRGTDPFGDFSAAPEVVHVDGFWMQVHETTMGEWFAFLREPEVAARIDARLEAEGLLHLVPRNQDSTAGLLGGLPPRWMSGAVREISYRDVEAYLAHVNARLEREGSPWVADLPTDAEWERAAAGADGRPYPWGTRFDPTLCDSVFAKPSPDTASVFAFPADESPFGVRGLAGSVSEWTATRHPAGEEARYVHGGSSVQSSSESFRIQSRQAHECDGVQGTIGFRLVYRARPGGE